MMLSVVVEKAPSFLFKKTNFNFPQSYELTHSKNGRFNMKTLRAGMILMPKRRIPADREVLAWAVAG